MKQKAKKRPGEDIKRYPAQRHELERNKWEAQSKGNRRQRRTKVQPPRDADGKHTRRHMVAESIQKEKKRPKKIHKKSQKFCVSDQNTKAFKTKGLKKAMKGKVSDSKIKAWF